MDDPYQMKPAQEELTPEVLVRWREQMGYSQRQAAEAIGCSRQGWGLWETGRHRIPIYIGLAMNALAVGMSPYGKEQDAVHGDE